MSEKYKVGQIKGSIIDGKNGRLSVYRPDKTKLLIEAPPQIIDLFLEALVEMTADVDTKIVKLPKEATNE
jgi:hypothetical protein